MYHGIIKIINNEFVWSYLGETRHSEINYPYGDEGEIVACDCLVIENLRLLTQAKGILKTHVLFLIRIAYLHTE